MQIKAIFVPSSKAMFQVTCFNAVIRRFESEGDGVSRLSSDCAFEFEEKGLLLSCSGIKYNRRHLNTKCTIYHQKHELKQFYCIYYGFIITQFQLKLLRQIPMESFHKIFQKKLAQHSESRVPVACSLLDTFHTQKSLLASAQTKRESTELKNQKIAEQNLKYRQNLQKKLTLLQQKHDKNRRQALTKVVKSQERRNNYRRDIFSKHKQGEKNIMREKLALFKEHTKQMQQYWDQKRLKTQRSFRSQSAAKPLYWESVQRKKGLERQESQKVIQAKSDLLEKLQGREQKVHKLHESKKEEIHEAHKEQIEKVLQKSNEILDAKIKSIIHNIGEDFRKSGEVLKSQSKAQEKKIKDRKIDDYEHRMTIRSNFLDRAKQRSASLSECACKRINNIEESAVSPLLKETVRNLHLGDTLRKLQRQPSQRLSKNEQFLTRSQSFRSTVSYNQSMLSQRKYIRDEDRLRREREIAESLALRKAMQIQGNCFVRKVRVK